MIKGAEPISVTLKHPAKIEESLTIDCWEMKNGQEELLSRYFNMDKFLKDNPQLNTDGPSILHVEFEGKHYFGLVALSKENK